MAENQVAIEAQVNQVKEEIREERRSQRMLGNNAHLSREDLLTFDMMECHPLIMDQKAYEFQWDKVDGLYQFIDKLPAWVMDDQIMELWGTGDEEAPQSFKGWEAKKAEFGQALMLSWAPARLSDVAAPQTEKVFSAVVVCIHPCQAVMSIKDGANDVFSFPRAKQRKDVSALCRLPKSSANTFYPSPLNDSFLVLPYYALPGEGKKVHLDSAVALNKHLVVRRLHRCRTAGGDQAVLPPIFSKDLCAPGTLPVGYMGPMWTNTVHVTVLPTGGTGLFQPAGQSVRPAISIVYFCADKKEARSSLACMSGDGVVYPEKWRDKPSEARERQKITHPGGDRSESRSSESDGEKPVEDGTPSAPSPKRNVGSSDEDDDAKSKQASRAGSNSDSSDGDSGSGSEDSS